MSEMIDLTDAAFRENRRASYRALRLNNPIAKTELNGEKITVVSRYDDVDNILRSSKSVVLPEGGEIPKHIGNGPASVVYRISLPMVDAPEHPKLRRIIFPAFGGKAVGRMKEWVNDIIEDRLN